MWGREVGFCKGRWGIFQDRELCNKVKTKVAIREFAI